MKLSIIIPIYNVEPFLRATLDSVVGQTYQDIEIICINDGSTDRSLQILEEYQSREGRMKVVSQQNAGLYATRQVGIRNATGEYILFLDGDDWLDVDACEKIAEKAAATHADIIQYGLQVETSNPNSEETLWFDAWFNVPTDSIDGSDEMLRLCYVERTIPWNIATKAIRTEIAREAIEYQEILRINQLEDFVSCFFLFSLSRKWVRLDARLYHYRYGTGMSTKSKMDISAFERNLQYFKGLQSAQNFAGRHHATLMGKDIANRVMPEYMMEDALHFVLHRLDSFADSRAWSGALAEAAGAERTVEALAAQVVSDQQALAGLRASEQRMVAKRAKYQRLFGIMCVVSAVLLASCLLILVVLL